MAPKGSRFAPAALGSVLPHGNGFRVHARVNGSQVKGPYRLTWARANADLHRAQSAQTHEEYAYILEQLRSEANLPASPDASSRAVSGVVPQPAASQPSQPNQEDRGHLDVSAKRPRTISSTGRVAPNSSSRGVTLCMRGLNIQWPFSQLLLIGAKTEEVRVYDLGHLNGRICKADDEVWIVETKGPHAKAMTNAIIHGVELAPRPTAAQIVGTVTFSGAFQYINREDFASARECHRIAVGSKYDWDGSGSRFRWQVARVRKLAKPIAVSKTGQTGFGPRSFTVEFADPDVCDDVGMEVESCP
jgi:hypothetical protein